MIIILSRRSSISPPCAIYYAMKKIVDSYYKTARWKNLRSRILRRDKYMCQLSLRYGKMVQADTVHHIFPRQLFPEYQWEDWNLISVSTATHERLHYRSGDGLTAEGLQLLERTARKNNIEFDKKRLNVM